MGKASGFLDYQRLEEKMRPVDERVKDYQAIHVSPAKEDVEKSGARCMNCGVPFCQSGMRINNMGVGCPLNNLIPEWNDLLFRGLWDLAYERLSMTAPFPEFTGRVCPALCEKACVSNLVLGPVNVKENELSIIEYAFENGLVKPMNITRNGKSILVVGSGPSGLSAANKLNHLGYAVTVCEKEDRIGGLLMYGIPNMKLDKKIIDRRVDLMKSEGVIFKTNAAITSFDGLDYDAIVLACGNTLPRDLVFKGHELKGIYQAVEFLKDNTKALLDNHAPKISGKGKRVLVVGGGDTGTDVVGTLIRQGAKSITQIEIRKQPPLANTNHWPEYPNNLKTDYGNEEAIHLFGHDIRIFEETLLEAKGEQSVSKVVLAKADNFKPVSGSEKELDIDMIILAVGFAGTEEKLAKSMDITLNKRLNPIENGMLIKNNVFVCGDMRNGQSLVVQAIKDGSDCALKVDEFLK